MRGSLFIDDELLGTVTFILSDEGMGGISGRLEATDNYIRYKGRIQSLCKTKGIANIDDFNFKIVLDDNTVLAPEGGVGVTDHQEIDEIIVDSSGLNQSLIERLKLERK